MLINKPQFNPEEIKFGDAVILKKHDYRFILGSRSNYSKFDNCDKGLVIDVQPLAITILLASKQQATISVDMVAEGSVEIIKLFEPIPVEDIQIAEALEVQSKKFKIKDGRK